MSKENLKTYILYRNEWLVIDGINLEQFNKMQEEDEAKGIKCIYSEKYKRNIYYNGIYDARDNSQEVAANRTLEYKRDPLKTPFHELTWNERKFLKEYHPKTYNELENADKKRRAAMLAKAKKFRKIAIDNRENELRDRRAKILEQLAQEERDLGLETTKEKLEKAARSDKYKNLTIIAMGLDIEKLKQELEDNKEHLNEEEYKQLLEGLAILKSLQN